MSQDPLGRRRSSGKPCFQLCINDLILHRVAHDLADRMHLKFSHDIGSMCFGGLDADSESGGYFLAALPFRKQLYNLAFARGKPVASEGSCIRGVPSGEPIQKNFGGARREKCLVIRKCFHGAYEIPVGVGLQNIRSGTRFDDVTNKLIRKMQRQNENGRFRE